jgi:hypothetical protein
MQTLKPMPNLMLALEPATVKRLTVQDYHRRSEMGILASDERTGLLNGQIAIVASKGTPHVLISLTLFSALIT